MRRTVALIILSCVCLSCAVSVCARVSKNAVHSDDPAYSSALAVANRFLQAWQTQDHETGIMMLSDSARQQTSADRLQVFFSPESGAAFEIEHGKRMNSRRYVFPVVLFHASGSAYRPHFCKVVVTRAGRDDWTIDNLP